MREVQMRGRDWVGGPGMRENAGVF
jgi:hypothetical protein